MRFVAYSDIHHDVYTNGIRLDDTISVEDQVTLYCNMNRISLAVFNGDWYRNTNPLQVVIKAAEASWKKRSDSGVTTVVNVGNHDRYTKSAFSGHAFGAAGIFTNDLAYVCVKDTIDTWSEQGVTFLFLPSGHVIDQAVVDYALSLPRPLVVLFHGLVIGSLLAAGVPASSGIDPNALRALRGDLYIGGDNHTPQMLDSLLGAPSFYCGAPMQHNWGDIGQARGWWDISINGKDISYEMIQSRSPRFLKFGFHTTDRDTLESVQQSLREKLDNMLGSVPGIIDIEVSGPVVDKLDKEKFIEWVKSTSECRLVLMRVDMNKERLVHELQTSATYEDKWSNYVAKACLDGFNSQILVDLGKQALEIARKKQ